VSISQTYITALYSLNITTSTGRHLLAESGCATCSSTIATLLAGEWLQRLTNKKIQDHFCSNAGSPLVTCSTTELEQTQWACWLEILHGSHIIQELFCNRVLMILLPCLYLQALFAVSWV
jgi:hypothetical protein